MSFKTKLIKIKGIFKAKIFWPTFTGVLHLKLRKRKMTKLQAECAKATLTQYLECLLIAKLRKRMRKQIELTAKDIRSTEYVNSEYNSKIIWICWLQGIDNAPEIVRMCFQSVLDYFGNEYEIIVLTEQNYSQYVNLPDNILKKYKKGVISRTHFSDLLRLELLTKYGGTWLDSTLFFSGKKLPEFMFDSDLFVFQSIWPQLFGRATRVESWFITAKPNNPMLLFTRDMLYRYWEKYNVLIDYWLIYDMFEFAIEQFPELWKKVMPVSQCDVHIFQDKLLDAYDEDIYNATIKRVGLHKLNWRFTDEQTSMPGTYYDHMIKTNKIYNG